MFDSKWKEIKSRIRDILDDPEMGIDIIQELASKAHRAHHVYLYRKCLYYCYSWLGDWIWKARWLHEAIKTWHPEQIIRLNEL